MMKTRKGYPVYPLTVAQKFHLYYLPFCPNAAVLNIGTSLTIGTDLIGMYSESPFTKHMREMKGCGYALQRTKRGMYISML